MDPNLFDFESLSQTDKPLDAIAPPQPMVFRAMQAND